MRKSTTGAQTNSPEDGRGETGSRDPIGRLVLHPFWDGGDAAVVRHSAGLGLRQGIFSLAVAFPIREGHIDPIFMVGMNY